MLKADLWPPHAHKCESMCTSDDSVRCGSSPSLRQGLLFTTVYTRRAAFWLPRDLLSLPPVLLQDTGITDVCSQAGLCVGLRGPNSGSHACLVNVLPTEPSLQPWSMPFCRCSDIICNLSSPLFRQAASILEHCIQPNTYSPPPSQWPEAAPDED